MGVGLLKGRPDHSCVVLGACCAAQGSAVFPPLHTLTPIWCTVAHRPQALGPRPRRLLPSQHPRAAPRQGPAAAVAREAENRSRQPAACRAAWPFAAARRRRRSRRRRAPPGMGQQPSKDSKEVARLDEILADKVRTAESLTPCGSLLSKRMWPGCLLGRAATGRATRPLATTWTSWPTKRMPSTCT